MAKFCLTLSSPFAIEEKLLDLLLQAVGDEVFTSVPVSSHGLPQSRLTNAEQVVGRGTSTQVQVIVTEQEMTTLLQSLREMFPGTGLLYWASPLAVEGRIE